MGGLRDKIVRFMYGRYGIDQLHLALLAVYFVLFIISIFVNFIVIGILMWADLIWMTFRMLSRNIAKRKGENEKFLKLWNPLKAKGQLAIRRVKERKAYRFRRCPYCKTVLRLPKRRGKHTVSCPRCHREFKVRILW